MTFPAFPGPYATQEDLAGYWRPLTDAEQSRATVLLGAAADRINELPNAANFVGSACHWVSLDAVKRAMIVSGDGIKSESQSMAGMDINRSFVNPMGDLYISSRELNRLRGRVGQSAGSVVLSSNARIPMQPWSFQRPVPRTRVDWMTVCPEAMALTVGAERHLLVVAATWWEYEDRTDYATFTTSDPTVARVDDGLVLAIGVGTATITARYEGLTAACLVTVS